MPSFKRYGMALCLNLESLNAKFEKSEFKSLCEILSAFTLVGGISTSQGVQLVRIAIIGTRVLSEGSSDKNN